MHGGNLPLRDEWILRARSVYPDAVKLARDLDIHSPKEIDTHVTLPSRESSR